MKFNCLLLLFCGLVCTYGCDNRTLRGAPNSNVVISPPSATVSLSATQQFSATVKNSSNQSVTWSLTGSGCSGADCGTIDANGLYRAPDNYIQGGSVTIVAASVVDPSQIGNADVRINSAVNVSVADASVDIGGTRRFTATVTGSANQAVTWSIAGDNCADNACGWIDETSGVYTAPDEPPNPATFQVRATSVADTSKAGNGNVTITLFSNQGFVGDYAFVLSGFENSGRVVAIGGAFRSSQNPDNSGRINGGVLEIDRSATSPLLPVLITGGGYSYGADNRGRIRLDTAVGTFTFRCAMNNPGSGQSGRIIVFQPDDPTHISGSGLIKKRDLSISALQGNFVFGFSGDGPNGRVGALGRFTFGAMLSAIVDLNMSGQTSSGLSIPPATPDGTVLGNTYGRRSVTFTGPPPPLPVQMKLSFYIVNQNEAFFITRERAANDPLLSGDALKQSNNLSISGPLIFYTTGLFSPGTSATVGRWVVSGSDLSGVLDQNSDAVITSNASLSGQISAPDSAGHGTLNFRVGQTGPENDYVFQLVDQNRGFLMETNLNDAAVATGFMEAQSQTTFSRASLNGPFVLGTASPGTCGCTSISGVATLDGASGKFTGARDTSRVEGVSPRDSLSGTFDVSTLGRGGMATTAPAAESSVLYAVSTDKLVAINIDPTNGLSVVSIFER